MPPRSRAIWSTLADVVSDQEALFILGRGPSMAIANEVALKFKETCQIQAEAYSSAEVMHGPVSIVGSGFPVLALASRDAAEVSVVDVADRLLRAGGPMFSSTSSLAWQARELPFIATGHRLTDPLVLVVAFYAFIEQLARRRGLDPDQAAASQQGDPNGMSALQAVIGADIFDGDARHENAALLVGDGRVHGVVPESAVPPDASLTELAGGLVAPGFVDLQGQWRRRRIVQ